MAITKTKLLIEISQNINTIATAVQLDGNSRFLDVCLHDKGLPIDLTEQVVRIHVRKPDGKTVFNQGEITDATAGRCQFALTAEMLSEAKELKAQISIWNSDTEILSTKVFKILVTESLRNDEEVEASNEFGVLVVLFTEIQSALELMRELVSAFGEPGEMAAAYGVDTFWAMLEHLAAGADVRQVLKENINSTMDTEKFRSLDKMMLELWGDMHIFDTPGTYTLEIPEYVKKIKVTACGGGGGGAGGGWTTQYYGVSGSDGGATVIGDLITLPGGGGGTGSEDGSPYSGGEAGGKGGGAGGTGVGGGDPALDDAGDGIAGSGGNPGTVGGSYVGAAGGGGGSLGAGGNGGKSKTTPGTAGNKGSGGGGGSAYCTNDSRAVGGGGGGGGGAAIVGTQFDYIWQCIENRCILWKYSDTGNSF